MASDQVEKQFIDRRLTEVSTMFYERSLSKTEIANACNISITHVNRLLREAQKRGIVQISIRPPRFEHLELRLSQRFRLHAARIVPSTDDPDTLRSELGREAAGYFDQNVHEGKSIGVSSGRTIFEMASFVPERPRNISIYPLNVVVDGDSSIRGVSANTVATILWFRSRPLSKAYRIEMFFPVQSVTVLRRRATELLQSPAAKELSERIGHLDVYLLGAGELRENSQVSSLLRSCGLDTPELVRRGIVGDIAFNLMGKDGEAIPGGIEDLMYRIDLADLKVAASSGGKLVILVAGGHEKIPCIRAALMARACNVLVTDSETAQGLLDTD